MRKLASIQEIKKLEPIPNADKIELATILGWKVVVRKEEFREGQLVVYVEVDSILPERPEFEFLRNRGFRIRTIKLRGQISQGIVFPISILPKDQKIEKGLDVTKILSIKKYEPPLSIQLSGEVKGKFPNFIPKTDEIRIQTIPELLEKYKGNKFYITEKLDGTSGTFYYKDGEFGVCSRNLDLMESDDNAFWIVARKYKLEEKLRNNGKNLAIQGEVLGPKIQDNRYELDDLILYFFNIFDIDEQRYYKFEEIRQFISELDLDMVPILDDDYTLDDSVDTLTELSYGKSNLNPKIYREGIVVRSLREIEDSEFDRVSFKVLNPSFLLKYESN
ncbi:MAG: RNA ligase (ATP) [Candidatus Lokiarchaeota archaeon]|nr:RNA ligase (ATP) [Candidatus Lokiarchaeota archaeon]MBD3342074.1 RNA ligase (ATP) [Candidatus Lokiarchaeota archaeon]